MFDLYLVFLQSFVYYVLRTVSLVVTRMDALQEALIMFEGTALKDVLKLCLAKHDFVRQQALHLISELGVSPESGLKQRVLKSGAVKVIIEVNFLVVYRSCFSYRGVVHGEITHQEYFC